MQLLQSACLKNGRYPWPESAVFGVFGQVVSADYKIQELRTRVEYTGR